MRASRAWGAPWSLLSPRRPTQPKIGDKKREAAPERDPASIDWVLGSGTEADADRIRGVERRRGAERVAVDELEVPSRARRDQRARLARILEVDARARDSERVGEGDSETPPGAADAQHSVAV